MNIANWSAFMDVKLATWEVFGLNVWWMPSTPSHEFVVILLKRIEFQEVPWKQISFSEKHFPPNTGRMSYCLSINTRPELNIHKSEIRPSLQMFILPPITLSKVKPDRDFRHVHVWTVLNKSPINLHLKAGVKRVSGSPSCESGNHHHIAGCTMPGSFWRWGHQHVLLTCIIIQDAKKQLFSRLDNNIDANMIYPVQSDMR